MLSLLNRIPQREIELQVCIFLCKNKTTNEFYASILFSVLSSILLKNIKILKFYQRFMQIGFLFIISNVTFSYFLQKPLRQCAISSISPFIREIVYDPQ